MLRISASNSMRCLGVDQPDHERQGVRRRHRQRQASLTRSSSKVLLAGVAALSVLGASAAAEPDVLGCFTRTYNRAHLARHPDQLVTAVKLHIYNGEGCRDVQSCPWFNAQFRVRGESKPLLTTGVCSKGFRMFVRNAVTPSGSGWSCIVECDGGGVNIVPRARDMMMYLDRISVATCGTDFIDDARGLTGGKDDRVFSLDRVDDAACTEMDIGVSKMLDRLGRPK